MTWFASQGQPKSLQLCSVGGMPASEYIPWQRSSAESVPISDLQKSSRVCVPPPQVTEHADHPPVVISKDIPCLFFTRMYVSVPAETAILVSVESDGFSSRQWGLPSTMEKPSQPLRCSQAKAISRWTSIPPRRNRWSPAPDFRRC